MEYMKQTDNAYIICERHAREWQQGGNDVGMTEMTPADMADARAEGWDGRCADCADRDDAIQTRLNAADAKQHHA